MLMHIGRHAHNARARNFLVAGQIEATFGRVSSCFFSSASELLQERK